MLKVMFVCYGNICRSPMAEFLLKNELKKRELLNKVSVSSSATSYEEIGNGVHHGTRVVLDEYGIDYSKKRAVKLQRDDYGKYDYFLVMDSQNLTDAKYILGGDVENKVIKLMDFTSKPRDVADPWYTRNFRVTERDILEGIDGFLSYLNRQNLI